MSISQSHNLHKPAKYWFQDMHALQRMFIQLSSVKSSQNYLSLLSLNKGRLIADNGFTMEEEYFVLILSQFI